MQDVEDHAGDGARSVLPVPTNSEVRKSAQSAAPPQMTLSTVVAAASAAATEAILSVLARAAPGVEAQLEVSRGYPLHVTVLWERGRHQCNSRVRSQYCIALRCVASLTQACSLFFIQQANPCQNYPFCGLAPSTIRLLGRTAALQASLDDEQGRVRDALPVVPGIPGHQLPHRRWVLGGRHAHRAGRQARHEVSVPHPPRTLAIPCSGAAWEQDLYRLLAASIGGLVEVSPECWLGQMLARESFELCGVWPLACSHFGSLQSSMLCMGMKAVASDRAMSHVGILKIPRDAIPQPTLALLSPQASAPGLRGHNSGAVPVSAFSKAQRPLPGMALGQEVAAGSEDADSHPGSSSDDVVVLDGRGEVPRRYRSGRGDSADRVSPLPAKPSTQGPWSQGRRMLRELGADAARGKVRPEQAETAPLDSAAPTGLGARSWDDARHSSGLSAIAAACQQLSHSMHSQEITSSGQSRGGQALPPPTQLHTPLPRPLPAWGRCGVSG